MVADIAEWQLDVVVVAKQTAVVGQQRLEVVFVEPVEEHQIVVKEQHFEVVLASC